MENKEMIKESLNNESSPVNYLQDDVVLEESVQHDRFRRSRKSKRAIKRINLDFLVTLLTIFSIVTVLFYGIFVTIHTTVDLNKNEKGEISLIIDYNENSEVNIPGQTIWPMIEDGLKVLKSML